MDDDSEWEIESTTTYYHSYRRDEDDREHRHCFSTTEWSAREYLNRDTSSCGRIGCKVAKITVYKLTHRVILDE